MISFFIDGRPKSTQSGSVIKDPRSGRLYPIRRNSEWAAVFGQCAREYRVTPLLTGPIEVTYRLYMQRPKARREYPMVSPDWDNLVKGLGDKLNGVIWEDDKQIVAAHVYKLYHGDGRVGVEVTIEEIPLTQGTKKTLPLVYHLAEQQEVLNG
jgi:Holliday junction resolvase RusA-like endonuclease